MRVDRSFPTNAPAKPAHSDDGTASGALAGAGSGLSARPGLVRDGTLDGRLEAVRARRRGHERHARPGRQSGAHVGAVLREVRLQHLLNLEEIGRAALLDGLRLGL